MMATIRLLEYLAIRKMSVSEIVAYLPKYHLATGAGRVPVGRQRRGNADADPVPPAPPGR
jgi:hypothetical protein